MKFLTLFALVLFSLTAFAADNLSDPVDENNVPQAMEERTNEAVNRSDAIDRNYVPATEESREEEEYIESDSDVLDRNALDEEAD